MILTCRDIEITNFLTDHGGATIEIISRSFFPSYNSAAKRLKKMNEEKLIKCGTHPVLNKKVYYTVKMPSVHRLVLTSLYIQLKDGIKYFQREYKIAKKVVDGIFIFDTGEILVVEVDIFNRTKDEKLNAVSKALQATGKPFQILVISKGQRAGGAERMQWDKIRKIKRISIDEVNTYERSSSPPRYSK